LGSGEEQKLNKMAFFFVAQFPHSLPQYMPVLRRAAGPRLRRYANVRGAKTAPGCIAWAKNRRFRATPSQRQFKRHLLRRWDRVPHFNARLPRQDDGQYLLADLTSSNGTFLNGARVFESTSLKNGDQIEIGNTNFAFRI
jgi:hypothetical protein